MMIKMKEHGKVTERQFAGIIANTLIGAGSLVLPRTITKAAGTAAWLSILIGGLFSFLIISLIVKIGFRFPEETLMEYSNRVLGKIFGNSISLLFCFYWLLLCSLVLRVFASMLSSAVLLNTPIEFIIISMLFLIIYYINHDIEVIGRVNELYFIFLIIPVIIGIFLSMKEIQVIRLMPVMGQKGFSSIVKGTLNSFFSFLGFEIIVLFLPSLVTPKLAYNYAIKGLISPLIIYLAIVISAIGVFGIEELQNLTWPTLELIKVIRFPGLILERVEAIFISFWVIAIFTTAGNLLYSSVLGMTQVFKLEDHKTLIYPLMPVVFFIAIFPGNVYQVFYYMEISSIIGTFLLFVIPLLIYVLSLIRNIRGDEQA
ncbi:endospore germination permease [Halocella sp. SP3-1]|uniref:GerAB/ArcD/ProY family transporter n=1 Tax=Halocella sp. SP3-1 TaxID=2382161 RepID=UPI000F74CBFF|nr:endospore germination permease [Halocella sp. SP3-1]AZO93608.1 spore gernimation protein [Halocella sp. SP3-1]